MANISSELMRRGNDPEKVYFNRFETTEVLVLTVAGQETPVYKYENNQRTNEIVGLRVTVHYMGLGEADVKEPASYQASVNELGFATLVNPKAYEIDRKIYVSADNLVPSKENK